MTLDSARRPTQLVACPSGDSLRRRRLSGGLPAIVVVDAAEDGVRHDPARLGQRLLLAGDTLFNALMGSRVIEVGDVLLDDAVKVALVGEQEVVQAFPS